MNIASGATITIDVLNNDATEGSPAVTICSVGQGELGAVTFTDGNVTYTPSSSFASGQDTFTYTITDGQGAYDTAQVTVTLVALQWQTPDETWEAIGDEEVAWSSDTLRWTAVYSSSASPASITWYAKAWGDRDNAEVPWVAFATGVGDAPATGNPGTGDWAIRPEVYFNGFDNQTSICAAPGQPINKVVQEILSVEWAQNTSSAGGELRVDLLQQVSASLPSVVPAAVSHDTSGGAVPQEQGARQ